MSEHFRRLKARVEADYQILASGLRMVRKEMHEGHAELAEILEQMKGDVQGLQRSTRALSESVGTLHGTVGALQESTEALQESVVKLAKRQDATARKLEAGMDALIEALDRTQTDLRDALEVMAGEFDQLEDLRGRVEALEEWKRHQTG